MVEYILLGAAGGFVASLPFWRRTATPVKHERLKWCSNCKAHLDGHGAGAMKCPCLFKDNDTGKWEIIKFFKPLTLDEWMKREGLD